MTLKTKNATLRTKTFTVKNIVYNGIITKLGNSATGVAKLLPLEASYGMQNAMRLKEYMQKNKRRTQIDETNNFDSKRTSNQSFKFKKRVIAMGYAKQLCACRKRKSR